MNILHALFPGEPREYYCQYCGKLMKRKQYRSSFDSRTGKEIPGAYYYVCNNPTSDYQYDACKYHRIDPED